MEESPQSSLAAIVFTDIVGFSRLMSEDESNALPRARAELARLKALCEKHHGKVLKSTGDGLLMHFTSAVKAVACALEIQNSRPDPDGAEPLRHRIGIHLGDVYLEEGDVMGDGVNIAARLQTQADPGGICISKTVYDVVKNRLAIQATFLGPRELKNITEAVPIYKILIEAQAGDAKPRRADTGQVPGWLIPLGLGVVLALLLVAIGLAVHSRMVNQPAAPAAAVPVAVTTAAAKPAAPLSPTAARVVGAWESVQRRSDVFFLPDGRLGIDLAYGDRKVLGIVGSWQAAGDDITIVRADTKKTTVNHILNLTDFQIIMQSDTGPRFLKRIQMPDLPIVTLSGMSNAVAKDPNRPQYPRVAETLPADPSYNAGIDSFNNGDYDQAIAKFTEALTLKPEFTNALITRAEARLLLGQYSDAVADCNAALAITPNDAMAYIYRGVAQKASGDVTAGQADIGQGQALLATPAPAPTPTH